MLVFASVTRISDLPERRPSLVARPRSEWASGDYVTGEVLDEGGGPGHVELASGRLAEVLPGDLVVGVLGQRAATLEVVGDWRDVGDDLRMDGLTRAGVFGRCTSVSVPSRPVLLPLRYRGHVVADGRAARMGDYVRPVSGRPFAVPVVLIVGTSMDAGKTTSAKAIVRLLKRRGLRVAGAKVTGVARYRDSLEMKDAGADMVVDLVDGGLPSTICPAEEYRRALDAILGRVADAGVDVLVAEAGASPLEPYNGETAIAVLSPNVRFTLLCASDPYAVLGVMRAFGTVPDLVAGRGASTSAGVALIERLCSVRALDLLDRSSHPALDAMLAESLGLHAGGSAPHSRRIAVR
jgi:hypothetical protein